MRRNIFVFAIGALLVSLWLMAPDLTHGSMNGRRAPDIRNETWINSEPLNFNQLRGKVVLVEFWTFGCYNCQNVEPFVKSWHDKFKERGLVVIGVHSPEFGHERVLKNVQNYLREHEIRYAVAIDNDYKTWKSFENRYWPAMYLIDKQGFIRYTRIGEGGYDQTETVIRELLAER